MKASDLRTDNKAIISDNPFYADQIDVEAVQGGVPEPQIINSANTDMAKAQSAASVLIASVVILLVLSFFASRLDSFGYSNVKPTAINLLVVTILAIVGIGISKQIASRMPDFAGIRTLILAT